MQLVLDPLNLQLLPTAVHPWMNPVTQTQLWPHEGSEIYQTYDKVFQCRSHGWSNVQSVHLNLPFNGDEEFAKLHAAVRIVLPLLPALTASSPVIDGHYSGLLDTRMMLYTDHCQQVPILTGELIPEPVFDEANYRREIFDRIAREIRASRPIAADESGVSQCAWGNRKIRPWLDRTACDGRARVSGRRRRDLRSGIGGGSCPVRRTLVEPPATNANANATLATAYSTKHASKRNMPSSTTPNCSSHFGITESKMTARKLWTKLLDQLRREDTTLAHLFAPLEIILSNGTLASRICAALGTEFSRESLEDVYREVGDSLRQWEPFQP